MNPEATPSGPLDLARLRELGRETGDIVHDFNNVLATILGFSDLLLEDLAGHPSYPDAAEIKKAAERGRALSARLQTRLREELGQNRYAEED